MKKLVSWVEIPATDMQQSVKFYNKVFNLDLKIESWGEEAMACFPNGEGAISIAPGFNPSKDGVLVSFETEKIESTLQIAEKNGGKTLQPKTKIQAEGRGYFALILDCAGNKIGLYEN